MHRERDGSLFCYKTCILRTRWPLMNFWDSDVRRPQNSAGICLYIVWDDEGGGFFTVHNIKTLQKILSFLRNLLMKIIEDLSVELKFQLSGFYVGQGFLCMVGFSPPLYFKEQKGAPWFRCAIHIYIHSWCSERNLCADDAFHSIQTGRRMWSGLWGMGDLIQEAGPGSAVLSHRDSFHIVSSFLRVNSGLLQPESHTLKEVWQN